MGHSQVARTLQLACQRFRIGSFRCLHPWALLRYPMGQLLLPGITLATRIRAILLCAATQTTVASSLQLANAMPSRHNRLRCPM